MFWKVLVFVFTLVLPFFIGCANPLGQEQGKEQQPRENSRNNNTTLQSCSPAPQPRPMKDWDIGKASKRNVRPPGYNYAGLWISAVWDPCVGTPPAENMPPTLEVDWIRGIAVDSSNHSDVIYPVLPGESGLWPSSYELGWRDNETWFRSQTDPNRAPIQAYPSVDAVLTGDVAWFRSPKKCDGNMIIHTFIGQRPWLPPGVTDIVVQARVRITGKMVLVIGHGWFQTATGGYVNQSDEYTKEGAISDFVGNECGTGWLIITSWDPATNKGDAFVDPIQDVSPPPPSTSSPPPTPPSGKITVDFTVLPAGQPIDNDNIWVRRKGKNSWEPLPGGQTGASAYQVTAKDFDIGSDVLVIDWKSNGNPKWGCMGNNQMMVNVTATAANGTTYSGYPVPNGKGGCDIGLIKQAAPVPPPPPPSCLNNCSGHGTCVNGQCQCFAGYAPPSCSSCLTGYTGYPYCQQPVPPPPPAQPWVKITQGNVAEGSSFEKKDSNGIHLSWEAYQAPVKITVEKLVGSNWEPFAQAAGQAEAKGDQWLYFLADWPVGPKLRVRLEAGTAKAYTGSFTLYAPVPPPNGKFTVNFTVLTSGLPVAGLTVERKGPSYGMLPVTPMGGANFQATTDAFLPGTDVLVIAWKSNSAVVNKWGCMDNNQMTVNVTAAAANGTTYSGYPVPNGKGGCDIGLK
ncbi:hypothetical protein EPN90_02360 [Patescibacteria group bacterium]|nr:MAG: hypothetical protein EPN90_02360 [Patescibacteria group bacterium]